MLSLTYRPITSSTANHYSHLIKDILFGLSSAELQLETNLLILFPSSERSVFQLHFFTLFLSKDAAWPLSASNIFCFILDF